MYKGAFPVKLLGKILGTLWVGIMKLTEIAIVIQLGLFVIILVYQVVMRYVFNSPPVWSEELALFLMVWVTFLGVGYGVNRRLHVRMSLFESYLPRFGRKILVLVTRGHRRGKKTRT